MTRNNCLEYKGFKTGTFYLLQNMPVKVRGFCSQKVWIRKESLYRVRDFLVLEFTNHNYQNCLWQIGKTVWTKT